MLWYFDLTAVIYLGTVLHKHIGGVGSHLLIILRGLGGLVEKYLYAYT